MDSRPPLAILAGVRVVSFTQFLLGPSGVQFLADMVTWDVQSFGQFVGVQLYFTPLVYGNGVAARRGDMIAGLVLEPFRGKMRRVGLLCTAEQTGPISEAISYLKRFSLPEIVVV